MSARTLYHSIVVRDDKEGSSFSPFSFFAGNFDRTDNGLFQRPGIDGPLLGANIPER
jgi:hypothetical protein